MRINIANEIRDFGGHDRNLKSADSMKHTTCDINTAKCTQKNK